LVPMAIPIGLFLLLRPERSWSERIRSAFRYAAAAATGPIVVAFIQKIFYGSPFQSGYGSLAALFSTQHVAPNAVRYASWMSQTHTIVWVLALAALFLLPGPLTLL